MCFYGSETNKPIQHIQDRGLQNKLNDINI